MEQAEVGCQVAVERRQTRQSEALWDDTFTVVTTDVVKDKVAFLVVVNLGSLEARWSWGLAGCPVARTPGAMRRYGRLRRWRS